VGYLEGTRLCSRIVEKSAYLRRAWAGGGFLPEV
jgi:hypothetical protein